MSDQSLWTTPCGRYAARLTDESWAQIERECAKAGAVETGGILVGWYTADKTTAVIEEALPPPEDSAQGSTWFCRGTAGLKRLLAMRWQGKHRTYYVGEWHYHPSRILESSDDDLTQMYSINSSPGYHCREPIMMIVGQAIRDQEDRPVRVFIFPQGEKYLEFQR